MTALLSFLEKHIKWRYLLALICMAVTFWLGSEYNNAVRDKEEARLILSHTKEIQQYCDSAFAAKQEAYDVIIEYKWKLFYKDRTIDSLKNIIKSIEDENKN